MTHNISVVEDMVLVKLKISAWLGSVRMKKAEETVESKHGAEAGTVDVKVKQLAKEYQAPIQHGMNVLRQYWYEHTLPWEDGGWRICPSEKYPKLMAEVAKMRKELWEPPVNRLLDNIDQVRKEAKKRLGDLFDERRFPTSENLADKYDVEITTTSVQRVGDIRIDGLAEEAMREIKNEVAQRYDAQVKKAMSEVIGRMREVINSVIERMDKNPKGTKYKGLWDQVKRMVEVLPQLNITNDKKITKIIDQVKAEIASVSTIALRESDQVRQDVKKKAKGIMADLDGFGKGLR